MTSERRTSIDEEATSWFVLLRDDAVGAEDRARFAVWLSADPRHRAAWLEVEAMWDGMDDLRNAGDAPHAAARRAASRTATGAASRRRRREFAAAAMILLMLGLAAFSVLQPPGSLSSLFADYRTGPDGGTTVALPDGSNVALTASSALSVAFEEGVRRVVLHRGEGYFAVTHDTARPFVVEAGGGTVTVVGTAFDVKLTEGRVAVAVASGIVDVARGEVDAVRLEAGQGLSYGPAGIESVHAIDVASVGTWRGGRLVFEAAPLGDVLADLERHRSGYIIVTDAAIAALPVTGTFDIRRADAALETIARVLPVRVTYVTDLLVLVGPAD